MRQVAIKTHAIFGERSCPASPSRLLAPMNRGCSRPLRCPVGGIPAPSRPGFSFVEFSFRGLHSCGQVALRGPTTVRVRVVSLGSLTCMGSFFCGTVREHIGRQRHSCSLRGGRGLAGAPSGFFWKPHPRASVRYLHRQGCLARWRRSTFVWFRRDRAHPRAILPIPAVNH